MTSYFNADDLDHILCHTSHIWEEVKGQTIFITGGTGFIGRWLLASFIWANEKLKLGAKTVVLSRNPEEFAKKIPYIAKHPSIHFIKGDIQNFSFPVGEYSFLIHAATDLNSRINRGNPLMMFESIVDGTHRALEFASTHGTKKFLLISSGAVYGKLLPEIKNIPEDYFCAPDLMEPNSAYGQAKRASEHLCSLYHNKFGLETKIARCFALVGPHLPIDIHYAIGNFIRDAVQNMPIHISGDGTPYRSYLYIADLAIWLWTILINGKLCHPYNVGADKGLSIKELAYIVREIVNPNIDVKIAQNADPLQSPQRYVPMIKRAQDELNLDSWVSLDQAIEKTVNWLKTQR